MKYCPYCGATLVGGAVSFCAECGRTLPSPAKPPGPVRRPQSYQAPRRKPPPVRKAPPPGSWSPKKPAQDHKKRRPLSHAPGKRPDPPRRPRPDPRDDGYDGYYDDVKPIDNGHIRERTDSALMKRIVFVAAGAFLLVIFAVIVMYVL